MDTELIKTSKAQSSYIATSTTSFLSALEPALTTALEEVSMDYLTLDTACRNLFEQMESRIGVTNFKSTALSESRRMETSRGFKIVINVLGELRRAEESGKGTPIADVELNVVGEVCKGWSGWDTGKG
jgi:hypothetical protein